ncbi:MAG: hypothetical protein GXY83_23665 [Rhodopirellula sp.]|nr:hypothetical protein [Rhodopirellula sp.]
MLQQCIEWYERFGAPEDEEEHRVEIGRLVDRIEQAFSDPAKVSPDRQMIGVWRHQDDGSTTYDLVGSLGGKSLESVMRVVIVTHEKSGELQKPEQAGLFPTVIDGTSYLNLARAKQEQLAKIQES